MKTQKLLVGTLIAGVAMFFLGWLVYGILLADFMAANMNSCNSRPMEEMVYWAIFLSNLVSGLLLTLVLNWSNSHTMLSGLKTGAFVGLLIGLSLDLGMYSMTTMFLNPMAIVVDVLCSAIMYGVVGAIVAMAVGKKAEASA